MHQGPGKNSIIITLSLLLTWPVFASAQIEITHIEYDPEGNDSGREWIEILNNSSSTLDLTGWKLFENNTNHRLSGDLVLNSGESAVIVDKEDLYRIDHPDYAGKLIDSSFSLKNTGEYLAIKDSDQNIIFEVNYREGGLAKPKPSSQIKAKAKLKSIARAGPDIITNNLDINFDGSDSIGKNFLWNFGDGYTSIEISPTHTYQFPGQYLVSLTVDNNTDTLLVIIYSSGLIISEFYPRPGWVELYNQSDQIINLSGWGLNDFIFPLNSLIAPNQYLVLPNILMQDSLKLIYPHGEVLQEINFEENDYAVVLNQDTYVYTELPTPNAPNFVLTKIKNQNSEISKAQKGHQNKISKINPKSYSATESKDNSALRIFPQLKTEPTVLTAGIGLLINKLVFPFALVLLLGILIGYILKKA